MQPQESERRFPVEIASAVTALSKQDARTVIAELMDHEGTLHHNDLCYELGWSHERIADTTMHLSIAGLVAKKNTGDLTDTRATTYVVTEYGYRVVEKLFEALGDGN